MNPIAKEPVVVAGLASIIVWFGARYGFNIDPAFATAAAGAVLVVAGGYARQLVTPTAKLEYKVEPNPTTYQPPVITPLPSPNQPSPAPAVTPRPPKGERP